MSNFENLVAYQKWRSFARRMVDYYPRIRKKSRRLADQLERAVESIGDAIAEGRGRATDKDFANFLTTAIASATEAEHHLLRALDFGIFKEDEHRSLCDDLIEIRKILIGLRRRLRGE